MEIFKIYKYEDIFLFFEELRIFKIYWIFGWNCHF